MARPNSFIVAVVVLTVVIAPITAVTTAAGAPQATSPGGDGSVETRAASDASVPPSGQDRGTRSVASSTSSSSSRESENASKNPDSCERGEDSRKRKGNESGDGPPRHPPDACEKDRTKKETQSGGIDEQSGIGTTGVRIQNATQDLRSIGINQTANGTIDTDDPYNTSFRGYYEPVTFYGEAGQFIRFNMRSSGDTYLYLVDPNGTVVASDDDGGDGLNSEIRRELQSTGNYTIIATSYDADATFEYELTVETARNRDLRSMSVGGAVYSTIEDADPYNSSLAAHYEPVTFHGEAGEEISIRMQAFASRQVLLLSPNGSVITRSDEYPASIEATLPTTGNYTVIVASDDGFVPYQLSILRQDHKNPSQVTVGSNVDGTVDTGDSYNETYDGYYESLSFEGQAGQDIAVSFESRDYYNKILYLLAPNGSVLVRNYVNDEGTALAAELPTNGTYRILVTSDNYTFQTFDYRLGVRKADHGDARSIGYDDSVTSTLENGDPNNTSYEGYHEPITFEGEAGDNISISLNSESSYGVVRLFSPNGTLLASASEYGAGAIKAQLPTNGTYTIIVNSRYYYSQTFEYQLSLTRDTHGDIHSIAQNVTLSSTLDTNDSQNASYNGEYHEAVVFEGTAGQDVNVSMRASGEDTYLYLLGPNGSVIAENDWNDIYGSQISLTLPVDGNYTVIAASDDYYSETFDYDLSVTVSQSDVRAIGANETLDGMVNTSDPYNSTYNGYHEPVSYNGTAGERVSFETISGEDTYLYLLAPNGSVIAENDDGGYYDSSEIAVTLPVNGTYTVIVSSDDSSDSFPYILRANREPVSTDLESISTDQTLRGEVDAGDPTDDTYQGLYEPVTVNATAGEEVTITVTPMREQYTDTYLYVLDPNGTVIAEADHGVVRGSRLDMTFPANGTYTIIVGTDYGNDRFEYGLALEPTDHGDVRSTTVGSVVVSTIDAGDPKSGQFGIHEPITFQAEAGQEISISRLELEGQYYDGRTRLTVVAPDGSIVANSTYYYYHGDMKMVLPTSGNYTIIADPVYGNTTGDYAFTITNDTHRNAKSVGLNQGVLGTLDTGDSKNSTYDGYYESVAYDGEAGQTIRIDLSPEGIEYTDSYLYLVAPNGTVIAQNDYGGYYGSRIETTLPVNGTYQIIVSNDYYDEDLFDYRLTVTSLGGTPTSGTANLSVTKYALSATNVAIGEPLNVTASVVNDGGVSGSMTVTLYVNGTAASQKTVTVPPGESATVPFSVTFDAAGTKSVSVNGLSATTVTVEPASVRANLSREWSAPFGDAKAGLTLADVDGDGDAEIGFSPHSSHGPSVYGIVENGEWLWNNSSAAAIKTRSAGDVDGDGDAEIIFHGKVDATWVRPYDANGSVHWSGTHSNWAGDSATVDADEDGRAEVLAHSAGEGGDLTVWDDNGTVLWNVANESHLDGLISTADVVGDDTPEVLSYRPPNGNKKGLNLLQKASDGGVTVVEQYGPEQPVRATFTDLDEDGVLEILAVYPRGGFVTAYEVNGTVQWNRTIAAGDDARLRTVTGDAVPDPVVWNGSNVTVMNSATGETFRANVSDQVRDAVGRSDGSVAVLTDSSVTVVSNGDVVDSVSVDGTNVTAFATGDTDGDGAEEVVVSNTTHLMAYDLTPETASFQVRNVSAPPSASVGSDVVVSADVVNTGNVSGSRTVAFTYETGSGTVTVSRNLTLDAGESTRVAFTFGSDISTAGSYSASIATANDSASASVEFTAQQFVCGVSTGDPHFVTFDGVAYDFQGVGEFVLANATNASDPLVVQVRHTPVEGSTAVSITNATATIVDGHTVQLNAEKSTPLSIDGSAVSLADGESVSVGNGTVMRTGSTYTIVYPGDDGVANSSDERLQVDVIGNRLDLRLCLHPDRSGSVGGLLGSPNGNASDDLALANGTVVGPDIDTDTLYGAYRDSWRVTNNTTVFVYENDRSPDFYYFPNYPEEIVTLSDLNDTVRERAEELAIEAGLEPGTAAFRDAVIDYALTGDSSYFASATTSSTSNVTTDATSSVGLTTAVELVPAETRANNGTTVTYEVVVTDAGGGVGAYAATVSVANGTVATVTNASLNGDPGLSNVTLADNNSSVRIEGALADTSDTGEVTIATVTVRATAEGATDIHLSVAAVGNETGTSYNISRTTGSTLNVTGIGTLRDIYSGPPTDVDGDGVYEDVNGDGEFNIVDVQALYTVRDDDVVQNNVNAFDVNEDGKVDIVDVQALYVELRN